MKGAPDTASETWFVGQIAPVRVELLDQSDLPSATSALQGMLSRASFKNGIERFKIDELVDMVLPCETGNELGFMFRQTSRQIIGDADIQGPIWLARENVDKERRAHCSCAPDASATPEQAAGCTADPKLSSSALRF
jgi:hypothetical protein